MSTANKKLTLQTLFFTQDVITGSNYVYLSLQTHQLSAISAVIGNRFTIVQVMVCAHVMSINTSPGKGSNSKIQFQRKKAVLFQMKCFSIYAVYLLQHLKIERLSDYRFSHKY